MESTSISGFESTDSVHLEPRSRPRPRLDISSASLKLENVSEINSPASSLNGGTLTPDVAKSPPCFESEQVGAIQVGNYVLTEPVVDTQSQAKIYKAFHPETDTNFICKVIEAADFENTFKAYMRVGYHEHINYLHEVVRAPSRSYLFFEPHFGDLHTYIRTKRRLREAEVGRLFAQITRAVGHCHDNGIVLRDFKLRRFVFKDPERTELKLFGLEEAILCEDDDDDLQAGTQSCPAYISPEILSPKKTSYSGRQTDLWSLGVMLYTMLLGRYPFHDREPGVLFMKIRKVEFALPDTISSRAKCLIRNLLRFEPSERLTTSEILQHPWFNSRSRIHASYSSKSDSKLTDQLVPRWSGNAGASDFDVFA